MSLDIVVLFLMLINEIISFISLGKHYYLDYMNYFDIICILYSVLIIIFYKLDRRQARTINRAFYYGRWFGVVKLGILAIVYFRTFLYLRIFGTFRYLINMVLNITKASFSTIFILLYMIVSYVI